MAFFNDSQRKTYTGFFNWEDGKTYRMTATLREEENFANGKMVPITVLKNLDTGETVERKYEFDLNRAIDSIGESYVDENTVLIITPHFKGKSEKGYDRWSFDVKADGEVLSAEGKTEESSAPF